ncbi:hypothetical protein PQX77_018383, partial [Marasmius sp. AFHP31]
MFNTSWLRDPLADSVMPRSSSSTILQVVTSEWGRSSKDHMPAIRSKLTLVYFLFASETPTLVNPSSPEWWDRDWSSDSLFSSDNEEDYADETGQYADSSFGTPHEDTPHLEHEPGEPEELDVNPPRDLPYDSDGDSQQPDHLKILLDNSSDPGYDFQEVDPDANHEEVDPGYKLDDEFSQPLAETNESFNGDSVDEPDYDSDGGSNYGPGYDDNNEDPDSFDPGSDNVEKSMSFYSSEGDQYEDGVSQYSDEWGIPPDDDDELYPQEYNDDGASQYSDESQIPADDSTHLEVDGQGAEDLSVEEYVDYDDRASQCSDDWGTPLDEQSDHGYESSCDNDNCYEDKADQYEYESNEGPYHHLALVPQCFPRSLWSLQLPKPNHIYLPRLNIPSKPIGILSVSLPLLETLSSHVPFLITLHAFESFFHATSVVFLRNLQLSRHFVSPLEGTAIIINYREHLLLPTEYNESDSQFGGEEIGVTHDAMDDLFGTSGFDENSVDDLEVPYDNGNQGEPGEWNGDSSTYIMDQNQNGCGNDLSSSEYLALTAQDFPRSLWSLQLPKRKELDQLTLPFSLTNTILHLLSVNTLSIVVQASFEPNLERLGTPLVLNKQSLQSDCFGVLDEEAVVRTASNQYCNRTMAVGSSIPVHPPDYQEPCDIRRSTGDRTRNNTLGLSLTSIIPHIRLHSKRIATVCFNSEDSSAIVKVTPNDVPSFPFTRHIADDSPKSTSNVYLGFVLPLLRSLHLFEHVASRTPFVGARARSKLIAKLLTSPRGSSVLTLKDNHQPVEGLIRTRNHDIPMWNTSFLLMTARLRPHCSCVSVPQITVPSDVTIPFGFLDKLADNMISLIFVAQPEAVTVPSLGPYTFPVFKVARALATEAEIVNCPVPRCFQTLDPSSIILISLKNLPSLIVTHTTNHCAWQSVLIVPIDGVEVFMLPNRFLFVPFSSRKVIHWSDNTPFSGIHTPSIPCAIHVSLSRQLHVTLHLHLPIINSSQISRDSSCEESADIPNETHEQQTRHSPFGIFPSTPVGPNPPPTICLGAQLGVTTSTQRTVARIVDLQPLYSKEDDGGSQNATHGRHSGGVPELTPINARHSGYSPSIRVQRLLTDPIRIEFEFPLQFIPRQNSTVLRRKNERLNGGVKTLSLTLSGAHFFLVAFVFPLNSRLGSIVCDHSPPIDHVMSKITRNLHGGSSSLLVTSSSTLLSQTAICSAHPQTDKPRGRSNPHVSLIKHFPPSFTGLKREHRGGSLLSNIGTNAMGNRPQFSPRRVEGQPATPKMFNDDSFHLVHIESARLSDSLHVNSRTSCLFSLDFFARLSTNSSSCSSTNSPTPAPALWLVLKTISLESHEGRLALTPRVPDITPLPLSLICFGAASTLQTLVLDFELLNRACSSAAITQDTQRERKEINVHPLHALTPPSQLLIVHSRALNPRWYPHHRYRNLSDDYQLPSPQEYGINPPRTSRPLSTTPYPQLPSLPIRNPADPLLRLRHHAVLDEEAVVQMASSQQREQNEISDIPVTKFVPISGVRPAIPYLSTNLCGRSRYLLDTPSPSLSSQASIKYARYQTDQPCYRSSLHSFLDVHFPPPFTQSMLDYGGDSLPIDIATNQIKNQSQFSLTSGNRQLVTARISDVGSPQPLHAGIIKGVQRLVGLRPHTQRRDDSDPTYSQPRSAEKLDNSQTRHLKTHFAEILPSPLDSSARLFINDSTHITTDFPTPTPVLWLGLQTLALDSHYHEFPPTLSFLAILPYPSCHDSQRLVASSILISFTHFSRPHFLLGDQSPPPFAQSVGSNLHWYPHLRYCNLSDHYQLATPAGILDDDLPQMLHARIIKGVWSSDSLHINPRSSCLSPPDSFAKLFANSPIRIIITTSLAPAPVLGLILETTSLDLRERRPVLTRRASDISPLHISFDRLGETNMMQILAFD